MRKPKIGIAANILIMDSGMMPGIYRAYVNNVYVESLEKAGCVPVMLPVLSDLEDVKAQVEGLDGIVLSGGWDIDPLLYGEQPLLQQGFTMSEVDRFFLAVIQAIRDYFVQLTAQSIYNQLFIFLISILNFFKASFLPKDVLNYTRNEQIGLGIILISK